MARRLPAIDHAECPEVRRLRRQTRDLTRENAWLRRRLRNLTQLLVQLMTGAGSGTGPE
jgi:hypothetical protein